MSGKILEDTGNMNQDDMGPAFEVANPSKAWHSSGIWWPNHLLFQKQSRVASSWFRLDSPKLRAVRGDG